jgi:acetolactate synthase-1/2/3 large subunit
MGNNMLEKKVINGGNILVKYFLERDVEYMFGIPSGQLLKMYDAVYRWGKEQGNKTIMFHYEQAAAHAADAYARATNNRGGCFGIVGPGAIHLVPGIRAAWRDNIHVIIIVP